MPFHPHAGLLLSLEGIDGTGKSTLQGLLADALQARGWTVQCSREPTVGPEGEALRTAARNGRRLPAEQELALLLADRRRHLSERIWPALARGEAVLLDRYYHSTAAYQGAAGLDPDRLIALNERFAPRPQWVVILDLPPAIALQRIGSRGAGSDAFEGLQNLQRVSRIYAQMQGQHILHLDAQRPPASSLQDILAALAERHLLDPQHANRALLAAPPPGADAAPASARNVWPILSVLRSELDAAVSVLEVGSGLGLHARVFSTALPQLRWQCSEHPAALPALQQAQQAHGPGSALAPIGLDAGSADWAVGDYDAVYSANTLHILRQDELEPFFAGASRALRPAGKLLVYGPFHRQGLPTSVGNAEFDARLRAEHPGRGIRDVAELDRIAARHSLQLDADIPMPAHNALRVWRRG